MEEGGSVSQGATASISTKELPLLTVHRFLLKERGHGGACSRPLASHQWARSCFSAEQEAASAQESRLSCARERLRLLPTGQGEEERWPWVGGRPSAPGSGQPPSPPWPQPCYVSHSPAEFDGLGGRAGGRAASLRSLHTWTGRLTW